MARVCALALSLAVGAWTMPVAAQDLDKGDPAFVSLGVGAFDITDRWTSAAFQAEYASDYRLWIFHPIAGVMVNTDAGGAAYAGVGIDLFFGSRIVVMPSFAPTYYWRGSSKDLGEWFEFRSSISAAYRFDDRSRLGVELYHMSNAGIGQHNPGVELVTLVLTMPFR